MAVIATFLVNLLCSVVSCDPKLPTPEIRTSNTDLHTASSSASSSRLFLVNGVGGNINRQLVSSSKSLESSTTSGTPDPEPYVLTKYGTLRGYFMRTAGNRRIYAFEGVPYANPPVGGLGRFRAADPLRPWNGLRDARRTGPDCLQLSLPKVLRVVGNEDCLYLNVYTPKIPALVGRKVTLPYPKYPVIIFIHGGSYYYGSGNDIGPSYLLDKDVVLVTFNFRLGVLAFLSTGDHLSPGNYGLKDQQAAIKWVYENIGGFGGDPNRITLMGHNSGGSAAHLHLLSSNGSAPLIRSGVSLSGSAFSYWGIKGPEESKRLTLSLGRIVNCPVNSMQALMVCLRRKNPVELVAAQYKLLEFSPFPFTLFAPVLEPLSAEAFLTQKPEVTYEKGEVPKGTPWIFGMTAHEGYLGLQMLKSFLTEGRLRTKWDQLAPTYLDYKYTSSDINRTTSQLTKFYFGRKSPLNVGEGKLAAVFGDRITLTGLNKGIEYHSKLGGPTYPYIFGFKGKYTLGHKVGRKPDNWGVGSGEDLYYFFNSSTFFPGFKKADTRELSMSNVVTTILANFAKTGEPSLPPDQDVYPNLWEPTTSNPHNIRFLQLNNEIKMIPQPYKKRINFWKRLGKSDPSLLDPLFSIK